MDVEVKCGSSQPKLCGDVRMGQATSGGLVTIAGIETPMTGQPHGWLGVQGAKPWVELGVFNIDVASDFEFM